MLLWFPRGQAEGTVATIPASEFPTWPGEVELDERHVFLLAPYLFQTMAVGRVTSPASVGQGWDGGA